MKPSKFSISVNFTNPLRKTIYLQIFPKVTKTVTARNVDMWNKQADF